MMITDDNNSLKGGADMTLLTRKELAEKLSVAPITIHRWKQEKGLPFKQFGTKTIRFDWEEVQAWINKHSEMN